MANKKSTEDVRSRYVQGGTTEVFSNRIGWWERRNYTKSSTDFEQIITTKYHKRPDLMAFDLYGRADYFYIILMYNNILDVNEEFVSGKTLILPTRERIMFEFSSNPSGGVSG